MIHMKNVGDSHALFLDTKTDMAYVISYWDDTPVLKFQPDCIGKDANGDVVCYLRTDKNNNWIAENSLGIQTKPVSMNKIEGIFEVEADFANQWIELQNKLQNTNTEQKNKVKP